MTDHIPPALREALKPTHEDYAKIQPLNLATGGNAIMAYGSRCMAAALRWAYEQVAIWGDELALENAAAALEQEAGT